MTLKDLLTKLDNYGPKCTGTVDFGSDYHSARLFEANQHQFRPGIAYISDPLSLPQADLQGSFLIICCGNVQDYSKYENSSFGLIFLDSSVSCSQLMNYLLEELSEVEQLNAGVHIMSNALFSGKGLQNLVDVAAEVFGNPVYVVDLQERYLAISSSLSDDEFYKNESDLGYINAEGLAFIRQNNIDEIARGSGKPCYFFNPIAGQGTLVASITIQGIEIAHAMLQESEHPFGEFDEALFARFSNLVSMELQKDSFYMENRDVMYSYFLGDILKGNSVSLGYVNERLALLGRTLKPNLWALVIPAFAYRESAIGPNLIIGSIKLFLPGALYVTYNNTILFLISKDESSALSEYEEKKLSTYLKANNLTAGLSNCFFDLLELSAFYKQALTASNMARELNETGPIFRYRDYYVYELLTLSGLSDKELLQMIRPGLLKLYDYEKEKDLELFHTLSLYLSTPGQPAKIAEALHIHKNTLLYRMSKIKEITGCDFSTGEDYMAFNLSIKILKYLHMLG